MDPEFSNKERANFFPIEMSPQIFYSDTREMLELQSSSKCVLLLLLLVVVVSVLFLPMEKSTEAKPHLKGSIYK